MTASSGVTDRVTVAYSLLAVERDEELSLLLDEELELSLLFDEELSLLLDWDEEVVLFAA